MKISWNYIPCWFVLTKPPFWCLNHGGFTPPFDGSFSLAPPGAPTRRMVCMRRYRAAANPGLKNSSEKSLRFKVSKLENGQKLEWDMKHLPTSVYHDISKSEKHCHASLGYSSSIGSGRFSPENLRAWKCFPWEFCGEIWWKSQPSVVYWGMF